MEPLDAGEWDDQHKEGSWSYLTGTEQRPRYGVIIGYMGQDSHVLDVGCGSAILARRGQYEWYTGIDLSSYIIARNKEEFGGCPEVDFMDAGNAHEMTPTSKYDCIIFNESLYYFEEPMKVLHKYSNFMTEGGIFIVSLFHPYGMTRLLWKNINKEGYKTIAGCKLMDHKGNGQWMIKCLVPPLDRTQYEDESSPK